ncbi:MAG: hypothetical protein OXH50_19900, partial [Gemmatimonadetes bacterium]|nr:hypothetical protein [Gemmatimonadota bacterium]
MIYRPGETDALSAAISAGEPPSAAFKAFDPHGNVIDITSDAGEWRIEFAGRFRAGPLVESGPGCPKGPHPANGKGAVPPA